MPFNLPGTLVPFHLLINPRLVIPSLIVKDIRQLDFLALRRAGYRGAVFDKDNCLTLPHKDQLVPELKDAWKECCEAFGENHVLIVSNSAGTHLDPGLIQAESVTYHLSVPVLRHQVFKPSYPCISAVRTYFASLPHPIQDNELIVVGDRLFTDVTLANRMARRLAVLPQAVASKDVSVTQEPGVMDPSSSDRISKSKRRVGPLSIWTSGVWAKESMFMRALEAGLLAGIRKYVASDNGIDHLSSLAQFVKVPPQANVSDVKPSLVKRFWTTVRRQ